MHLETYYGLGDQSIDDDYKVFLTYMVARLGAYHNYFGYSPSYETGGTTSVTGLCVEDFC